MQLQRNSRFYNKEVNIHSVVTVYIGASTMYDLYPKIYHYLYAFDILIHTITLTNDNWTMCWRVMVWISLL